MLVKIPCIIHGIGKAHFTRGTSSDILPEKEVTTVVAEEETAVGGCDGELQEREKNEKKISKRFSSTTNQKRMNNDRKKNK